MIFYKFTAPNSEQLDNPLFSLYNNSVDLRYGTQLYP